MGKEQRFLVIKDKDSKEIKYFEYDKINGYNITPKNNVRFVDAVNVNKMILINPTLIEKLIDKKIDKKFKYLINIMSIVCDNSNNNDDDDTTEGLYLALDETEKFRNELCNKYKNYIKEEKYKLLEKKIAILEDELNLRIKYMMYSFEKENEKDRKSR